MSDENTPDADTILTRLGQKLTGGEDDDGAQTDDSTDTGQKADDDPDDDAGQKQPEGDGDGDAVEDLVAALADELGEDPHDLMQALGLGQDADDDEDMDEEEDDEDAGEKAEDDAEDTTSVSIDFGAKLDEHDVVTQDQLESFGESIVEDVGEKLAEQNQEAVEEIAQKMTEGSTPTPAGGTFQDEQDFESQVKELADGEGW